MTQAGTSLTYTWRFGDGSTASGQTPSHTFQKYGRMTVALTVRDPLGQTATVQTTVSILPPKPSACFHFHQGASLSVAFDGSCSSGTQLGYSWSFGDSSDSVVSGKAATSHTYAAPGTYEVQLRVTDAANQSATASASVAVTIPAPTARFTWQADQFLTVGFDASASTGGQLSYSWDYGDGQSDPDAGPRTVHFYNFPGTYTVTLTVTDSFGRSATSRQTVTVSGF
jgi:PKD repeat protein